MDKELREVERAAERAARSHERLEQAIREAHGRGASLRAIAEKANVSHEQVRRIVGKPPEQDFRANRLDGVLEVKWPGG